MTDITMQDLQNLLLYFSKNTYRAKDSNTTVIQIIIQNYEQILILFNKLNVNKIKNVIYKNLK